jgi:hypothetical protein
LKAYRIPIAVSTWKRRPSRPRIVSLCLCKRPRSGSRNEDLGYVTSSGWAIVGDFESGKESPEFRSVRPVLPRKTTVARLAADAVFPNLVLAGGLSLIVGALSFVAVFAYLAAKFDYPKVLDGTASEVLPRLRAGGSTMRAVWAVYAVLPLLLIVGAVGTAFALPSSPGTMALATAFACVGALVMCLGLMRWPSIHWVLAEPMSPPAPMPSTASLQRSQG